jgi:hypothetical protein
VIFSLKISLFDELFFLQEGNREFEDRILFLIKLPKLASKKSNRTLKKILDMAGTQLFFKTYGNFN